MKKVLLLGASYEIINFIDMKRAIKLLYLDKIEIISSWDEILTYGSGSLFYPSIVVLKNSPKKHFFIKNLHFNRRAVVKRDKSTCQYCSRKLTPQQITIDHLIPKCQGGGNSFFNCVVACHTCNNKKGDRTPEQANMTLLRKPTLPSMVNYIDLPNQWHNEWDNFIIL